MEQLIENLRAGAWNELEAAFAVGEHRRPAVSCYSWPDVHPVARVERGLEDIRQSSLKKLLLEKGEADLSGLGKGYGVV